MKILVVEDEALLSDAICKLLCDAGYFTDAVSDGRDAVYYSMEAGYDLILMDVMLPEMDGMEAVRRMRRNGVQTPVLMLTAKDAAPDKVSGLNAGADDYMTKPFHADELLARVRALTRRRGELILEALSYGDICLDLNGALLQCGEESVQLTKREFEVARFFLRNCGMTITKESLLVHVWGEDSDAADNTVEAYISFLRKKLRFLKANVTIRSIYGIGYRLEEGAC